MTRADDIDQARAVPLFHVVEAACGCATPAEEHKLLGLGLGFTERGIRKLSRVEIDWYLAGCPGAPEPTDTAPPAGEPDPTDGAPPQIAAPPSVPTHPGEELEHVMELQNGGTTRTTAPGEDETVSSGRSRHEPSKPHDISDEPTTFKADDDPGDASNAAPIRDPALRDVINTFNERMKSAEPGLSKMKAVSDAIAAIYSLYPDGDHDAIDRVSDLAIDVYDMAPDDVQIALGNGVRRAQAQDFSARPNGADQPRDHAKSKSHGDAGIGQRPPPNGETKFAPSSVPLTLDDWATRNLPAADFISGDWLTTTSRTLLVAPTGIGKTMFTLGLSFAIAFGLAFLNWRGRRKARVLFIDGEMSRRLLQQRLRDEEKRWGERPPNFYALSHEDLEDFAPLNTPRGQKQVEAVISRIGGVDLIVFDNIMSLISGDMKDEEGWRQILPWLKRLTARQIGQLWVHHTGHDESESYGTKTREWQMDTFIIFEPVEHPQTDVSFRLVFRKARERTPETRGDFVEQHVTLIDDRWSSSQQGKPAAKTAKPPPPPKQ
jgi:hypothetical protein